MKRKDQNAVSSKMEQELLQQPAEKAMLQVGEEQIKEYFPILAHVALVKMEIYKELLNLKFTQLPAAQVWYENLACYIANIKSKMKNTMKTPGMREAVRSSGILTGSLPPETIRIGTPAVFPLHKGVNIPDGTVIPPAAAMLCNFEKPQKESLLYHIDG